jgi:hypothetical protein
LITINGSTDIPTVQANIEWYLERNYHGKIDATKWESLGDGILGMVLYRWGEQSVLEHPKQELHSYILR